MNTRKQRRRLGVNFMSILKAAKKLSKNSDFAPVTRLQFAEAILEEITSKNLPKLAKEGIDLDALLAFIMALLPLILEIISIFT